MDFMKILNSCVLCPHKCHSSRIKGELGVCKAGSTAEISSVIVHMEKNLQFQDFGVLVQFFLPSAT